MFAVSFHSFQYKYLILLGALKATGNRGLQPAMDHILEHEGQPIPDAVSEQASSSGPMDVDNEDEDAEALKSLGVVAGNVVEAKVRVKQQERVSILAWLTCAFTVYPGRASNAQNVVKSSRTQLWPTSMRKGVVMTSLRSRPKK